MNTKLIISIFLVLISMIGVGCVSAADNQNSIQMSMEEMNVEKEMANEENLIKTQSEPDKKVEKSANKYESSDRYFRNTDVVNSFIKNLNKNNNTNNSNNQTIKSGVNDTNNSDNKTHYGPKLDIKGPKVNKSNNGTHYGPKLDIKGPKGNNNTINGPIDPSKGLKMLNKTKTFDYKGEKVYLAVMQDGSERKLYIFKAGSNTAGMNGAGGSCVGEVGTELLDILEEKGVIDAWAYNIVFKKLWLPLKIASLFDDDALDDATINFIINYVTFGNETKKYIYP